MVRRGLTVALAGALAASPLAAGSATAESIVETVEAALGYHPQVFRDQALSVAAEHTVEEAYSDFLPSIDIDASTGYEATSSPTTRGAGRGWVDKVRSDASISLTQLLFDFHETSNRVASAESELEASNADLQATSERIARIATDLYLRVLGTRERLALADRNVEDLSEIFDLIRGRAEAGRAAEADLDQAISRVALARADQAARQGEARQAASRFIENVGHMPGSLRRPAVPDYPEATDLDAALAMAMDRNPIAHSTAALWEARKSDIEVERASFFPRVDLEASGRTGNNLDGIEGGDSDIRFLVRLTWNIFNGFGDLASTRAATQEANAASRIDAEARRAIREAVRIAFRDLETAQERLPELQADADASARTFEAYRQQYDVGQRSLLDLLDARDELFDAQEAEVTGFYDVLQAHYDLLFSMGILLESLGVVVFQDEDQYRERWGEESADAGENALESTLAVHNAGLTASEIDWSHEVALPGAADFGAWLGTDGQSYGPRGGGAETVALPAAVAAPAAGAAQEARAAARAFRREFVGIEVEIVPAMHALPEQEIAVLPSMPLGALDSFAGSGFLVVDIDDGAPVADTPSQAEATELPGDAQADALGVREDDGEDGGTGFLEEAVLDIFDPVLEELAALPKGAPAVEGRFVGPDR